MIDQVVDPNGREPDISAESEAIQEILENAGVDSDVIDLVQRQVGILEHQVLTLQDRIDPVQIIRFCDRQIKESPYGTGADEFTGWIEALKTVKAWTEF